MLEKLQKLLPAMDSLNSCEDASGRCLGQPFSALENVKKEVDLLLAAGDVDNALRPLEKRPRNPAVLILWLEEHCLSPYPSKDEKRVLAHYAGMTQRQLNDWFANARRNIKKIGYAVWKEKHSAFSARFSVSLTPESSNSEPGSSSLCHGALEEDAAVTSSATGISKPQAAIKPIATTPRPRVQKFKKSTSCHQSLPPGHHSFQPYYLPAHLTVPHSSTTRGATTFRHLPVNTPAFYQLQGFSFGPMGHPTVQCPQQTLQFSSPPPSRSSTGDEYSDGVPPLWGGSAAPSISSPGDTANTPCYPVQSATPTTASLTPHLVAPLEDSVVTTFVETTPNNEELDTAPSSSIAAITPEASWSQSSLPHTMANQSTAPPECLSELSACTVPSQEFTVAWTTASNYPPTQ